MRGLDKAIEEVQSARNRVSRLYGLGRLGKDKMVVLTNKLEDIEQTMYQFEEDENERTGREEGTGSETGGGNTEARNAFIGG